MRSLSGEEGTFLELTSVWRTRPQWRWGSGASLRSTAAGRAGRRTSQTDWQLVDTLRQSTIYLVQQLADMGGWEVAKYFYFLIKVNLVIENLDFFSRVFWLDWVYSGHLLEWSEEERREQRCIFTFLFSLGSSDHCDANQNFLHSTSTLQNLREKTGVNLLTLAGGRGEGKLLYEETLWLLIENWAASQPARATK